MDNKGQDTKHDSRVNFSVQEIVQKQFKNKMRGYDSDEVDEYLDKIIKDYEYFTKTTAQLTEENQRLMAKVDELTRQLNATKNIKPAASQPSSAATNYDILKRLSNLERHVFGSKLNTQQTITEQESVNTPPASEDLSATRSFNPNMSRQSQGVHSEAHSDDDYTRF